MGQILADEGKIIPTVETVIVWEDKILLQKRSETAKKFPGFLIGPGGHVDNNEDFKSAAIREVWEETGVSVKKEQVKLRAVAIGRHSDRKETYLALVFLFRLEKEPEIIESDEGKLVWVKIEELSERQDIFPPFEYYLKHAISENQSILYTNLVFENLILKSESSVNY